jgi:putative membrane protein
VSGPGPPPTPARPSPADAHALAGLGGEWQRLHPLSPLVRAGRGLVAIVVLLVVRTAGAGHGSASEALINLAILVAAVALGVVYWLVTRWRVEGGVLRVDSGLIRRTSERFPLTQIQAIDVVRPGLARVFGLAELRIRMAGGGGKAGRLSYLSVEEADDLRARLLALSKGVTAPGPAEGGDVVQRAPERVLVTVPPPRLLASMALSGAGFVVELTIAALVVLAVFAPGVAAAAVSAGTLALIGVGFGFFRRFNGSYRLTVSEAHDGLRLRSGLIELSAETIPRGRIQAVRMVEPLAWRPCGWCRLEVDVASQKSKGRQDRTQSKAARALLPVGSREQARVLLANLFTGLPEQERRRPPSRARWKSPLRFRHLSWAANDAYAVTTSGRLQRVTDWVPLAKVQSVRCVEGPVQRRLRLSSIHLDTAGRNVHAVLRDRDRLEAARLLRELPERCRQARQGVRA